LRRDGLSVSSIGRWLECREQFRLRYAEGWRSTRTSAALDFGELWHWLLGRQYQNRGKEKRIEKVLHFYDGVFKEENPQASVRRVEDLHLSIAKTAALWPTYQRKYGKEDTARKWVDVEYAFDVEYDHWPLNFPIPLHGIFDGVFLEDSGKSVKPTKGLKRYWLFETKTKSRIDEFEIEDCMHLDLQVMMYALCMRLEFGAWPKGVLYNVIRNPQSTPSKKSGEDLPTFTERLTETIAKDEDHYFKRWKMKFKTEMLEQWEEKFFQPLLLDIWNWVHGGPHYANPNALVGKYGRSDMFGPITSGNFSDVYRKPLKKKEVER